MLIRFGQGKPIISSVFFICIFLLYEHLGIPNQNQPFIAVGTTGTERGGLASQIAGTEKAEGCEVICPVCRISFAGPRNHPVFVPCQLKTHLS